MMNEEENGYELNFHCASVEEHSRFLQRHSSDVLSLEEQGMYTVRVISMTENTTGGKSRLRISKVLQRLQTSWLGRVLIHSPRIPSTQDILKITLRSWKASLHGWVSTACIQTNGRGRRGTTWVSPNGSVSMTLCIHVDSEMMRNHGLDQVLIFMQYIGAMAVCEAAPKAANVRIKWPNDVYVTEEDNPNMNIQKKECKVSGILCEGVMNNEKDGSGFSCDIFVGVGVNVYNQAPAASLYQHEHENNREEFIAKFLNAYEKFYNAFRIRGFTGDLLERYLQLWLHHDQHVRIGNETGPEAVIKGIAPNGWVRVLRKDLDAIQDIFPDSSSLDLEAGVIREKV